MTGFFQTHLDQHPEVMRSGVMLDGGRNSFDRQLEREVRRNKVIVDFPPVRQPFIGIVTAVRRGIDELQDTRYLVLRDCEHGNRQFGRGWEGAFDERGNWYEKPTGHICPRHSCAFEARWYSERYVRFIDNKEMAK